MTKIPGSAQDITVKSTVLDAQAHLYLLASNALHVVKKKSEFPVRFFGFVTVMHPLERGSFMVWEINMGVCPRLEFDNIMFINCLGYDFYIYGAFEFLCNSNANL